MLSSNDADPGTEEREKQSYNPNNFQQFTFHFHPCFLVGKKILKKICVFADFEFNTQNVLSR